MRGIIVTGRAAQKIRSLFGGTTEGQGLRVKVVEGGSSGFEYKIEIDFPGREDHVFEKDGTLVLLDAKSILHLNGTEIDNKDELMQSGFVFNNPNIKGGMRLRNLV
ncbi:MAG: HesB/IscA family protein [Chloroflexota bacterium]